MRRVRDTVSVVLTAMDREAAAARAARRPVGQTRETIRKALSESDVWLSPADVSKALLKLKSEGVIKTRRRKWYLT